MSVTAQPFIEYLQQLERQGETHVHLDEQATLILREFYKKAKGITDAPVTKLAPDDEDTSEDSTPTSPEKAAAPAETKPISVAKGSKAEQIASLKKQAALYAPVKELGTLRDKLVFSSGDPDADIMLIGECPGYHDEKAQQPFSGPAGTKLDGILKAMGLTRDQVYITYIVKYRPSMENQTTGNRKPTEAEIYENKVFVAQEIKVVSPKVILALGATASQILLRSKESLDSLRGEFHKPFGIPIRATYPPSYLLNAEGKSDKRQVWEDMLATMELLDMPTTEKQKGYFL